MLRLPRTKLLLVAFCFIADSLCPCAKAAGDDAKQLDFFEKNVRPLLAEKCWECHGPKKSSGNLRLDSATAVARGGDSGAPVQPGEPNESLLIEAVRRRSELKMPPDRPLSSSEIVALEKWVSGGAIFPLSAGTRPATAAAAQAPPRAPDDGSLAESIQLWLSAETLTTEDGKPVPIWTDRSGRGHDFTLTKGVRDNGVGTAPQFIKRSRINGMPAVRFAAGNGMASSPDHRISIEGDAALTIVLVVALQQLTSDPPFDNVLMIGDPAPGADPQRPLAAYLEIDRSKKEPQLDYAGGFGHDAGLGPGSATKLYDEPHILTVVKTPGPANQVRFYLDGKSAEQVWGRAVSGTAAVPDIRHRKDIGVSIGKGASWSGNIAGDYGEVIVYDRALDDAERTGVERGLSTKYGMITKLMIAAAGRKFTPAEKNHWAFQAVADPSPPATTRRDWAATPIDQFILSRLEQHGLAPAPSADRRTMIRRATFDLIGLPPTPAEVAAFVNDPEPDDSAWARLVDRLLASPQYGVRWGRVWLDAARYADTTANDGNFVMRYAYRYRDYVIDSLNRDKPYDQFVVEQLAGDQLPKTGDAERDAEQIIATGFLMVGPKALAETDKEQVKLDIADEQLDVTGRAFMGLTITCARCHDHKFDPIPTVDYYSLAGIFRSTEMFSDLTRNASKWLEYPVSLNGASLPVMAARDGPLVHLRVHVRGNRFRQGEVAPRRFLQIIAGENHDPILRPVSGRLELARWIAANGHPLTARVIVNRIWQSHFGRGIVATSDNFGARGSAPSHPRLLDYLARRFMESNWSIKRLHGDIMMSQCYRQSAFAEPPGRAKAIELDPDNRLLWRFSRRRLEAEQFRDALLMISGNLDSRLRGDQLIDKLFKSGQMLDEKRGVVAATANSDWEGFDSNRRSIYLPVVRNAQPDVLSLFDGPDTNAVTPRRLETTVASQAAFLLNNKFVLSRAAEFAARIAVESDVERRIDRAYREAVARSATAEELADGKSFLAQYRQIAAQRGAAADAAEQQAWTSYCQLLFCLNELIYVE
ncbi:MAG: PSD1 and planctomycete cytochrome C domain-containing protein [Pirellulaceae bacterium]|jgi:hypothetical protein|nr:PSD1 and planctomycete cytochrome C domain-containing protein [Pirellulaceae bacterium]